MVNDTKSKSSCTKTNSASSSSSSSTTKKQVASAEQHFEILTEHFGFSPKIILERLGYLSNEHLYRIGETFESFALQCLLDQIKDKDSNRPSSKGNKNKSSNQQQVNDDEEEEEEEERERIKLEAESGVHSILTLFENALDHTIDTFELLLYKSVCGITKNQADNLILDHHKGLDLRSKERRESDYRKFKRELKGKSSSGGGGKKGKDVGSSEGDVGIQVQEELDLETYSKSLDEKERSLRRKINAAKATRSTLKSALTLSEKRLERVNQLHRNFSLLLGDSSSSSSSSTNGATQDSNPISSEPIEKTIPLSARKLRADSITLLKSLKELRSLNPLGESLDSTSNNNNRSNDDDVDGDGKNNVPWTNREDYIKWNSNKVTANLVTERKDRDRNGNGKDPSSDDYSSGVPSSSSGVRRSIGSKRGRMDEDDEQDLRRKKVGKLEDLESLSAKLSNQN